MISSGSLALREKKCEVKRTDLILFFARSRNVHDVVRRKRSAFARHNVNRNPARGIDLSFNLSSSERHCPSLLNNLFLAPSALAGIPRCFRRVGRCVTTSDDNFLGRTSPPRGSCAPTYVGSWKGPRKGVGGRERQQSHFPSGELSSPRNIVADIVFDATRREAARV